MDDAGVLSKLRFLLQADDLKSVMRQSPLLDESRRENAAEHSWHVALFALILRDFARPGVQIDRVVQMLLIHDLVEIDAGDTPLHSQSFGSQAKAELAAAIRLFGLLPASQGTTYLELWREFEEGYSEDARFARAIDRFQPLLTNVAVGGGTWTAAGVSRSQILARYGPTIEMGSPELWRVAHSLVEDHCEGRPFASSWGNNVL